MRMGRGTMSQLVMAWRVLEYNCDDSKHLDDVDVVDGELIY